MESALPAAAASAPGEAGAREGSVLVVREGGLAERRLREAEGAGAGARVERRLDVGPAAGEARGLDLDQVGEGAAVELDDEAAQLGERREDLVALREEAAARQRLELLERERLRERPRLDRRRRPRRHRRERHPERADAGDHPDERADLVLLLRLGVVVERRRRHRRREPRPLRRQPAELVGPRVRRAVEPHVVRADDEDDLVEFGADPRHAEDRRAAPAVEQPVDRLCRARVPFAVRAAHEE